MEIFWQKISIWESKTTNDNVDFLYFDQRGNLVIFEKDDSIVWSAGFRQNAEKLVMQDDGNVLLYKGDGQSVWATGTNDKCHSDKGSKLTFRKPNWIKILFLFYLILLALLALICLVSLY